MKDWDYLVLAVDVGRRGRRYMRGILGSHHRRETVLDIHKSSRRSSWEFIVLELMERGRGLG